MRVLITGIAGHLGSSLAKWVLKNKPGVKVFGIDDLSCGYRENVPLDVSWFTIGDVAGGTLPTLCKDSYFDIVYHFAAYAAECLSPFIRCHNYNNNLICTARVVNAMLRARASGRLVFTSSMAVYGHGKPPFDEDDHCLPNDPYGIAKLACEHDIRVAGEQHGLDWCVIRPHNIYGPGQSMWQKYRNVLGLWMRAALEGKPILVFGDGYQCRAFSYIDDILPCLWEAGTAARASKEIINLGGSMPCQIGNAASMVSEITGAKITFAEARHEVKRAYATTEKSERLLGYKDRTNLVDGITNMWTWAKQAWEQFPERRSIQEPFNIEMPIGLPSYWKAQLTGRIAA